MLVGRIVAANLVPDAVTSPELEATLAKDGEPEAPLTTKQHQELLMKVLEENSSLGKLDGWKKEKALKAKHLLMEYHHIFSLEKNEIGCTDTTKHVIDLLSKQDEPFKERFRRIAPHEVEEVWQHIQEMLDGGAIWPFQSSWCNAVVLVQKKDGTLRFCIDFRQLNARTKKDSYPIPKCPDTVESLVGAHYFSTMDLKSSFWQVKVSEDSRQYMAFMVGIMGVYKFLRMPYGLCNAPATFQCLMQNCLGELNLSFAMVYLEDVIVYSETPEDHLTWLQAVFDCFTHHGLKLKLSKCHFFKEEISYLDHEISAKRMLRRQKGVEEIACMGPPTTYTGIRKFIRAVRFFRTLKGSTDMALLFVVPACKRQAVLVLCHQDVGHQGRDRTYSLLQERFWWPKMRTQMMMALQNCEKCKIYEKKDPKAPRACSPDTGENDCQVRQQMM